MIVHIAESLCSLARLLVSHITNFEVLTHFNSLRKVLALVRGVKGERRGKIRQSSFSRLLSLVFSHSSHIITLIFIVVSNFPSLALIVVAVVVVAVSKSEVKKG